MRRSSQSNASTQDQHARIYSPATVVRTSNIARQIMPEITFEMSFGGPNRTSSHASVPGDAQRTDASMPSSGMIRLPMKK